MLLFSFSFLLTLNISAQVEKDKTSDGYNLHRVTKQQTLFGLSKEYNISIDEIKNANGGLPNGLQEGMLIRIPVKKNVDIAKDEPALLEKQEKKSFFEYQARGKEMIYQLAVRYQVSVDSILVWNPGISETLKADQIIRIPVVKNTTGFITHQVKLNQSLAKLAKNYDITVNEIKAVNPYVSRDLQAGQVIRIPVMKMDSDDGLAIVIPSAAADKPLVEEPEIIVSPDDFCKKDHSSENFKIALMLPLYLNQLDSVATTRIESETNMPKVEYLKSFAFIQFYEGFLMAVDSLENNGLHCELYVYNVEDDAFDTKKLLTNPQLKNMDLIVGPVFAKSFGVVAAFARDNQINIVNPFSTRNEILFNNPNVFKVKPSAEFQYETLVDFLNITQKNSEIFLVRQNQYRDEIEFNKLKSVLDQKLISQQFEPYHEITYGNDSLVSFLQRASYQKQNMIIIFSENKAFILDMLRKLNEIRDRYQITVVGLPNWKKMEDIEIEHLINLNTHLLAVDFINYNSPVVKGFVKKFREKYMIEPQQYAFEGFDTGAFFISALMKYGKNLGDCIHHFEYDGLQSGFKFERFPENGFSNKYWKVLKIANYNYENVSPSLND